MRDPFECKCGRRLVEPDVPDECEGCGFPEDMCECVTFCEDCQKPLSEIPPEQGNDLEDHKVWHKDFEKKRVENQALLLGES